MLDFFTGKYFGGQIFLLPICLDFLDVIEHAGYSQMRLGSAS